MSEPFDLLHAFARTLVAFADPAMSTQDRVTTLRAAGRSARRAGLDVQDGSIDGDDRVLVNGVPLSPLAMGHEVVLEVMRLHGVRRLLVRRHAGARDIAQMAGLLVRDPENESPDGTAIATALDELRLWGVRLVPAAVITSNVTLPTEVETALGALTQATDAERETLAARFLSVLTDVARRERTRRGPIVARAVARALIGGDAVRDALKTQGATQSVLLIALADAVVAADDATRDDALTVFKTAGEAATVGLIALLTKATNIRQRRRCFDALIAIGSGTPAIISALRDEHWYVVRNVAQLLGELRAVEAVSALEVTLFHADSRVRTSAAEALEQIGTLEARIALRQAITDKLPEIRRLAARAFAGATDVSGGSSTTVQLVSAFDLEDDPETQLELVRALGTVGTPPAVQRLVRLVGGPGGETQPSAVRVAALEALVRARGRSMLPTLRSLRQDRDPAIRSMARQLEVTIAA